MKFLESSAIFNQQINYIKMHILVAILYDSNINTKMFLLYLPSIIIKINNSYVILFLFNPSSLYILLSWIIGLVGLYFNYITFVGNISMDGPIKHGWVWLVQWCNCSLVNSINFASSSERMIFNFTIFEASFQKL